MQIGGCPPGVDCDGHPERNITTPEIGGDMSNEALSRVITHYNSDESNSLIYGGKIGVINYTDLGRRKDSYNIEIFTFSTNKGDMETTNTWFAKGGIHIKTKGGNYGEGSRINRLLNTASNIKSTLDHENAHLNGIHSEVKAIQSQRKNKSVWEKTTPAYKTSIKEYEKRSN